MHIAIAMISSFLVTSVVVAKFSMHSITSDRFDKVDSFAKLDERYNSFAMSMSLNMEHHIKHHMLKYLMLAMPLPLETRFNSIYIAGQKKIAGLWRQFRLELIQLYTWATVDKAQRFIIPTDVCTFFLSTAFAIFIIEMIWVCIKGISLAVNLRCKQRFSQINWRIRSNK